MQEVDYVKEKFSLKGDYTIKGVLGIIQIAPVSYLLVVTEHKWVCELSIPKKARIYEITETKLIKLNNESYTENKELESAINRAMAYGFYYSPDIDLTQRQEPVKDSEEDDWVKSSEQDQVYFLKAQL